MATSPGILDTNQRSVGRPPAKHSSLDYAQMTVYVPKTLSELSENAPLSKGSRNERARCKATQKLA